MAFPCFDGVYLPKQENNFLHHVLDELETYQQKNSHNSVLLFPPLPSRLRYLIHKIIEDLPELTTFSVGESWCRRVVVCPCELRFVGQTLVCMSYAFLKKTIINFKKKCFCRSEVEEDSDLESNTDRVPKLSADSSAMCPHEEEKLVLRLDEDEASVLEQTQSQFAELTVEEDEKEKDETASVSRSLQTEDIKAHLKEGVSVAIEHVHNDYSMYENVSIDSDDFRHVIEIYDFPVMFKTDDLLDAFSEYSDGGMKIKWVDNTHALGIFSSESAALHALSICHPLLKARALADGSKKAQGKAIRRPVKERPRTDCAVARRMVTRALGIQGRGRVQRY
uniref:R3H and coiled-coil domain-containing protein 1-like n=1 Tax=Haplochromis burtoni TaxID=8153 RepID=A0A3Q2WEA3_HAPBU